MAIGTFLTVAGLIASAVVPGLVTYSGLSGHGYKKIEKEYDKFYDALSKEGFNNVNAVNVLNDGLRTNRINEEEYRKALNTIKEIDKYTNGKFEWADIKNHLSHNKSTQENVADLYKTLTDLVPDFSAAVRRAASITSDEFRAGLMNSIPSIADVPKPTYYNVDSVTDDNLKDVKPMYLPTGQELADYNGINYDPNYYYDLIKQGTEAAVNYADFQNKVTNNNSMLQDTTTNNSYLDSIRSAKQNAIAKGATAGARAASELLATSDAMGNYSNTQMQSADTQMQNISKPLLQDAQAKLTARDYFNKLAQNLMTSGLTFYDSDATRYGAEWDRNATLYQGNNALRAGYDTANAMMNAAHTQNQATVNAARSRLNSMANQYAWLFERGLEANGNTPDGVAKTIGDIFKFIDSSATNGQYRDLVDWTIVQNNK